MSHSATTQLALIVLDGAFQGKAWQGPTLSGSLRGVKPELALWKPYARRRCIWEQMLHATYWKLTILRVFDPATDLTVLRPGGNWPRVPHVRGATAAAAWKDDLARLQQVHAGVLSAVKQLPERMWHTRRARTTGAARSLTYAQYLAGAAAHDAYHTGQIRLLKRMYRERQARD
jgi:hypothetical protein